MFHGVSLCHGLVPESAYNMTSDSTVHNSCISLTEGVLEVWEKKVLIALKEDKLFGL
jgi:hypothetical protein